MKALVELVSCLVAPTAMNFPLAQWDVHCMEAMIQIVLEAHWQTRQVECQGVAYDANPVGSILEDMIARAAASTSAHPNVGWLVWRRGDFGLHLPDGL